MSTKSSKLQHLSEGTRQEMLAIVAEHHLCDYNTLLLANAKYSTDKMYLLKVTSLPDNIDANFLVVHHQEIMEDITNWYENGARAQAVNLLKEVKRDIERLLADTYTRIISHPRHQGDAPSMMVDYYKNLLTYLYYHVFIVDNRHILGYDERRKDFIPLIDFQQQIVVLETLAHGTGQGNCVPDMRPSVLTDRFGLQPEGNNSLENPISKFKDRTKALHQAFHKKTTWIPFPYLIATIFEAYPSLALLYATIPSHRKR